MWVQGVWRLRVLSLGLLGRLVSRIPSSLGLELGHGSMGRSVTLKTTLIHLSEDGEGLETGLGFGIDRFFNQLLPAIQLC